MFRQLAIIACGCALVVSGCASAPSDAKAPSPWVEASSPSDESRIRAGFAPKYGRDVFDSGNNPALEHRRNMQRLAPVEPRDSGHDPGMDMWRWAPQFKPRDPEDIPVPKDEQVGVDPLDPHRPILPRGREGRAFLEEAVDPEREITIDFLGKGTYCLGKDGKVAWVPVHPRESR